MWSEALQPGLPSIMTTGLSHHTASYVPAGIELHAENYSPSPTLSKVTASTVLSNLLASLGALNLKVSLQLDFLPSDSQ